MLEAQKNQLTKLGNAVRTRLGAASIAQGKGFRGDIFDALIAKNKTLVNELLQLSPLPTKALKLLDETDNLMATVSNYKINDEPWPAALGLGTSLRIAALKKAHDELRYWDNASFEKRMQAIFRYLGDDSTYDDWCAAFVSSCLAGVQPTKWSAAGVVRQSSKGALRLLEKFQSDPSTKNLVKKSFGNDPTPGDIIFWKRADEKGNIDSGYGHVGFVFAVNGDRVVTLEGNSSMSVSLHEYKNKFNKSSKHQFHNVLRLP